MIFNYLIIFLVAFCLALSISPIVYSTTKKLKAGQTILHYVTEHESKNGTPTMGGIIFIVSTVLVSLCFIRTSFYLSMLTIIVFVSYAILGFLDDFLKVYYKHNLGLKAYQKIIGQVGISLIIAIFVYKSNLVTTSIFIPFTNKTFDLGYFIIPFVVFVYLAVVNSVNLIDGLDGLSSGVSFVYILGFVCVLMVYEQYLAVQGLVEIQNIERICFCLCGSLLAYFVINSYPAKIFMGDTGSLAIGGFIATIAVVTGLELYIPILGILFVVTACSDIVQVLHYKRTHKRIFLMAPLHHHFQKKGVNESKIVTIYIIVAMIVFLFTITLLMYMVRNGNFN